MKCYHCGRPILMLRHVLTRRQAALDPEPSARGTLRVDLTAGTYVYVTRHRPFYRSHGGLHEFHRATCARQQERQR
jgi:hypothetical protein